MATLPRPFSLIIAYIPVIYQVYIRYIPLRKRSLVTGTEHENLSSQVPRSTCSLAIDNVSCELFARAITAPCVASEPRSEPSATRVAQSRWKSRSMNLLCSIHRAGKNSFRTNRISFTIDSPVTRDRRSGVALPAFLRKHQIILA